MPGIWIAAIATTALSLALIGIVTLAIAPRELRRLLVLAMLVHLPMCAAAYYLVRLPLNSGLKDLLAGWPAALFWCRTFYAPLTEEPAKLWLLLVPGFRRRLNPTTAVPLGLAIGLGFGIGEMWLIATWLARRPEVAAIPWYLLGGYIGERFMVCLCHAAFTTTALRSMRTRPVRSVLLAIGLHWLGNIAISLAAVNAGGFGPAAWQVILPIWLNLFFVAMIGLLIYYYSTARPARNPLAPFPQANWPKPSLQPTQPVVFPAARDPLVVAFMSVIFVLLAAVGLGSLAAPILRPLPIPLPLVLIGSSIPALACCVLILWVLTGSRYVISPAELTVRFGPFRQRIAVGDIVEAFLVSDPALLLGGLHYRYALSVDAILIKYRPKRRGLRLGLMKPEVLISPADRRRFLETLLAVAPQLARTNGGDGSDENQPTHR